MAYEDWIDTTPKRYASKPHPSEVTDDGEIYGWIGDGWYYMDENGMLCGGRHNSQNTARLYRAELKAARQAWKDAHPEGDNEQ